MMVSLVFRVLVDAGFACPGKESGEASAAGAAAGERCVPAAAAAVDGKIGAGSNPANCARRADLVGVEACSWTTGMMAQRVLEEGAPWTFVGRLTASTNALPSKVAAPYTLGPDQRIHVVANEVLEQLQESGIVGQRLEFVGRLLDVNGTTYFVATQVKANQS